MLRVFNIWTCDYRADSFYERALSAQLNVIDAMKFYGNKPACVPITKELIAYGRNARCKYHQDLGETKLREKRLKEDEERQKRKGKRNNLKSRK